jgi:hypothetical protein
VSNGEKWAGICSVEATVVLDAAPLCIPHDAPDDSPVDDFYEYVAAVLPLGTEQALETTAAFGRILLLGLVAGVELYFRTVLSGIVRVCPLARTQASDHPVSLAAIDYYGSDDIGLGLLENISFATAGEIAKQTERLAGIKWERTSSLGVAIAEFEKLGHLRHAAVHARGNLSPRNVRELRLSSGKRVALRLRLADLHLAAAVCQNVVRAYNRLVFRRLVERWIGEKVLFGDWKRDGERFSRLFSLFHSVRDRAGSDIAYNAYRALRPTLIRTAAKT